MRSSGVDETAKSRFSGRQSVPLVHVACGLCGANDPEPVAVGEDFEYRTSDETFLMVRCRGCGLLYLNPRPAGAQAEQYTTGSEPGGATGNARANIAVRMARRLEAERLLRSCRGLPARARVLALECGDGFELAFIREFSARDARFVGVEQDPMAVSAARARGLTVHQGTLAEAELAPSSFDLVFAGRTLECSGDPGALLVQIRRVLRPGGLLVAEIGNAGSPGSRVFRDRYWGGYRFPRAWNLFTRTTVARLAGTSGLRVKNVATRVGPLAWIYSIRNVLLDARAPGWLVACFSRRATGALALFTVIDAFAVCAGGGSLLRVTLERPSF